jgi:hypothetical protein
VTTNKKTAWYGVRTVYRICAEGAPKKRDQRYDPKSTLIEDRVVLFQARGLDDAIAQAKKEASAYCRQTKYVNLYGQRVRMRCLGAYDAYEICEMKQGKPGAGSEVFSTTEVVHAAVSDSAIVSRRMGALNSEAEEARYKFINAGILRKALALVESGKVSTKA